MEILASTIAIVNTFGYGRGMDDRLNRQHWLDAGLERLASHGPQGLRIMAIAEQLGVTKGSFYWHFDSLQALITAALKRWEAMDGEALDEVRPIEDPRARLEALFVQSMQKREAHALYVALALSSDADVAAAVRRVSERRLRFLVDSYRQLGLVASEARPRALLAYSAYVGALHLRRQRARGLNSEKDLAAYVAHAVGTLIPTRTG